MFENFEKISWLEAMDNPTSSSYKTRSLVKANFFLGGRKVSAFGSKKFPEGIEKAFKVPGDPDAMPVFGFKVFELEPTFNLINLNTGIEYDIRYAPSFVVDEIKFSDDQINMNILEGESPLGLPVDKFQILPVTESEEKAIRGRE